MGWSSLFHSGWNKTPPRWYCCNQQPLTLWYSARRFELKQHTLCWWWRLFISLRYRSSSKRLLSVRHGTSDLHLGYVRVGRDAYKWNSSRRLQQKGFPSGNGGRLRILRVKSWSREARQNGRDKKAAVREICWQGVQRRQYSKGYGTVFKIYKVNFGSQI